MARANKKPKRSAPKVSVADSLAHYVEYLAWRSYADGSDSDDLRHYEEAEDLEVEELWSDYWYAWHRLMLHTAYVALDAEHRKDPAVLRVMKQAERRYAAILKAEKVPAKIDHAKRSRVFSGSKWTELEYSLPEGKELAAAERWWKKLEA